MTNTSGVPENRPPHEVNRDKPALEAAAPAVGIGGRLGACRTYCGKNMTFILAISSAGLATIAFYQSAQSHGLSWRAADQFFLVISPCLIFFVTTLAYYLFLTEYTGKIAGLSLLGLFAALWCCLRLLDAPHGDWEAHLRYLYLLFGSYVCWDSIMLGWFFSDSDENRHEVEVISTHINQPTLLAILFIWFFVHHLGIGITEGYVDGVIAFHLLFAFFATLRMLSYWRLKW